MASIGVATTGAAAHYSGYLISGQMLCSNAIEPDAEVIKYMFKYNDKNRCLVVSRLSDGSEGLGR